MTLTTCEIIWLRWLLVDMSVCLKDATTIHCDNKNVIHITHNSVFHKQTKHIETDCHFTRGHLQPDIISLPFVHLILLILNIFTKSHSILHFHFLFDKLSIYSIITL